MYAQGNLLNEFVADVAFESHLVQTVIVVAHAL